MLGDVRDPVIVEKALRGIDILYHLAARVGVGQSNYHIRDYIEENIVGMATVLDIIVNKSLPIKKIILTASMTSYGEGKYTCSKCGIVRPALRESKRDLYHGSWDPMCPVCGGKIVPIPTDEGTSINNNSVYALTKNTQEGLLQYIGTLYKIPFVSLRCFNVYGPRQSLSNPYTGVAAIFISRLKHNAAPLVYEDGLQTRDFVSVHDVVAALIAAMEHRRANFETINIGSGHATTIRYLAVSIARLMKKNISPHMLYRLRKKDIRHCDADITKAKKLLGWRPRMSLQKGLRELITWSQNQSAVDLVEMADKELRNKSLV